MAYVLQLSLALGEAQPVSLLEGPPQVLLLVL
jgi:hypothetical protein